MAIPRFTAQIGQIQIPSMKNYQAEQNQSIAESLAKFGSDLMTGAMRAKKDKDSRYNELLQEGKTLSGKDDTVEAKKNEELMKDSYDASFYNDALTNLGEIAKNNEDNPAEVELQSNAYIDGVVSEMPEMQQKEVRKSLSVLKDSYSKQSLSAYNERQVSGAKDDIAGNMSQARELALDASRNGAPEEIQMVSSMNYVQNVHKAKEAGEITDVQEVKLIEAFGQDIIVNHLGDILAQPDITPEQQLAWVRKFIDGKTGDEFIDTIMSPTERADAVNKAIANMHHLESFKESQKKQKEAASADAFNALYVRNSQLASISNDFYMHQNLENQLIRAAQTPEQMNLARNFVGTIGKPTNTFAKIEMDKALQSGVLTEEAVNSALNARVLSAEDYAKYMDALKQPLAINKKKDAIQVALAQARKSYGYTPFGQNNAYDAFMANLDAKLADSLMTNQELQRAAKESFEETDKLYPKAANKTVKKIEDFNQKFGIGVDAVTNEVEVKSRELAATMAGSPKKVTADIMAKAQEQTLNEIAERWMKQNNKTEEDFNLFVQEYKEASGGE